MKISNRYEKKNYIRVGAWGKPDYFECKECKHKTRSHSAIKSHIRRKHSVN